MAQDQRRQDDPLEDTGIKLDCVASDILGKSGRAMLDALVAGTTDPEVLADLAQGKLRAKIPALKQALEGRFEAHHALVIGAILAHLDFLEEQIDRLSEAIEEQLGPTTSSAPTGDARTPCSRSPTSSPSPDQPSTATSNTAPAERGTLISKGGRTGTARIPVKLAAARVHGRA